MEIGLATPALLFPAVSLLLLAYTNRFLGLASLIRGLAARYSESRDQLLIGQIDNLRHRLTLIRRMQAFGVASIFLCVACMFALFAGSQAAGKVAVRRQPGAADGVAGALVPGDPAEHAGAEHPAVHAGKSRGPRRTLV